MDPNQTAESMRTIQPILFWLVASLTALCAIATVVTQNIVRAATWLLFTLAGTSAVFFLLGADLVGVTQLLVYVGGTLVLVVFGVMLTAQGPFISMKTSGAEWAISVVAGMLLLAVLTTAVMSEHVQMGPPRVPAEVEMIPGQRQKIKAHPYVSLLAPTRSRAEREVQAARQAAKASAPETPPLPPGPLGGPKGGGPKAGPKGGPPDKGPKGGPAGGTPKGPGGKGAKGDKGAEGGKKGGPVPPFAKGPALLAPPEAPVTSLEEPAAALDPATSPQAVVLGEGFLGVAVGPAHMSSDHHLTRTSYLLPFEIVSVHLLVVLIGAAYLARAKRRRGAMP